MTNIRVNLLDAEAEYEDPTILRRGDLIQVLAGCIIEELEMKDGQLVLTVRAESGRVSLT